MLMTNPATGSSEGSAPRALGVDDDDVAGGVSGGGGELIRKSSKSKDPMSLSQSKRPAISSNVQSTLQL